MTVARLKGQIPDVFDRGDDYTIVQFEAAKLRIVHQQRARTLRQRGEFVLTIGRTKTGKKTFAWFVPGPEPLVLDVPSL